LEFLNSMKKYTTLIFYFFFLKFSFCQNLITNGDFEIKKKCPSGISQINRVKNWRTPSFGSPDYFNKCKKGNVGVNNFGGYQEPHSGNGYTGLIYGLNINPPLISTEYIQTKLKTNLTKNQLYCINLYISLADFELYAVKHIDIGFSKYWLFRFHKKNIKLNNVIKLFNNDKSFLNSKEKWQCVKSVYLANGKEKFITVGKLTKNPMYKQISSEKIVGKWISNTYYYIDDVSLIQIKDSCECYCEEDTVLKVDADLRSSKKDTISEFKKAEIGQIITLNNIIFETDKWELLPASYEELDTLLKLLQENQQMQIEVSGHTDNTGTEEHNKELSENRAKAVVEYLMSKNIAKVRLSYKGYGSLKPISDNETEEGRSKNRRVEFKILSK